MRIERVVKVSCALLALYVLQLIVHRRVSDYLSDVRLSRSFASMHLSVDIGKQAKLLCPVRTDDLTWLLWTKVEDNGKQLVLGNYSTLVVKDHRIWLNLTWLPDSDMYYSWLMIGNVREGDDGMYLCHNRLVDRTFMEVNVEVRKMIN